MTRQEIIDLIHNEYDAAPAHYKLGDNWDDGSGRIADVIMQRIEALEAALWVFTGVLRAPSSYINDAYELHVKRLEYEKACAALAPKQPQERADG
jgi:hypothetical protein